MKELGREGLMLRDRMPIPAKCAAEKVKLCGEYYDIPLSAKVLSKHVLIDGAIGTGKTAAMRNLLRTLIASMTTQDVMIVFDTKGDFRKEFYRPGIDEVISCDETATVIWNMFREISLDGKAQEELNMMELLNGLFDEKIRRSNDPFFPKAAKDVLFGIMTYIMRRVEPAERTNEELYLYLRDASMEDVIDSLDEMDDLRGLLDYIYSGAGITEQSQGVYSELRAVANELLISKFREAGQFSVREFVRNKGAKILFVEYDLGIGSVLTPIYKVLYDLAIKETLCRKKSEGNVYFIIDEFSLLPHLYHIADGVNFGRDLGAKFIVAIQNCRQVIEAYGEQNAYSILSAFGTLISFRSAERTTQTFIQDHYGTSRGAVSFVGRDYTQGSQTSYITGKTVEDWDLLRLSVGEAIVSVSDYCADPVRFQFKNPD